MAKLQGQLQQAEAESAVHAAELTRLRHELQESQSSVVRLEESMKREEEEHAAALQVSCSQSAARICIPLQRKAVHSMATHV